MNKKTIFKWLTLLSAIIGIYLQMFDSSVDFMGGPSMMLYFTIQSNLWMAVISALGLIIIYKHKEPSNTYYLIKYILLVGILLTYVVFSLMLSPGLPLSYLLTPSNILVHTLTPLFSVVDYLVSDRRLYNKKQYLYGLITPLYYLIFANLMYVMGIKFSGSNFPYFFLDFIENGWFSFGNGKIGVIYWYVIVLGIVIGISIATIKLRRSMNKHMVIYTALTMVLLTLIMTFLQTII